jgi:hypothetical protein
MVADVDPDDVAALTRQTNRVGASLAACHAGDEGDLAFESLNHANRPS